MTGELEFLNTRSRSWWRMRELLDPTSGHLIALPNDPRLIGELTTPRYRVNSSGKIQIESKDEIRKRLAAIEDGGNRQNQSATRMGRSTDAADAVIMAFDDGEAGQNWTGLSVISKKKTSRWSA